MHHAPWRGPDFSPFFSETRCLKTASIKPNATASSTMAAVTRRSVCTARAFFSASVCVRSASRASPVTTVVSGGASSTLASAASLSADFSLLAASFPYAADDVPVFPVTAVTGFVSRVTATVYTAVSPLSDVTVNSKSTVLPPAPRFLRFTRTEQPSAG